jgi:hypothetical protein
VWRASVVVVGLGHWFNKFGLRVNFGDASSSFWLVGFCFSSGSYSYPSTQARDHLINAIRWKRNLGAPNLSRRTRRLSEQVRHRAAPAFQSGFNCFL